uniref:Uncharacterized protein LOC116951022 n=1 Tax=Petromyzon marinus TaxID=7757 RepID=A0AAJ7TYS8_PETMA|nr:uncharacterized protein LOC116951022 [Petromyzon marinus]
MQVAAALCATLLWASRMETAIHAGVRVRVRPGWAVRARVGDRLSLWCEVTLLAGLPEGPLSPLPHDPDLPAAVTVRWLRVPSSEGGAREPAPLTLVLETRGTQAPRAGPGYGARVRSGELCVEAMCGRGLGQKLTLGPLRGGEDAGGYACEAAWDLPRTSSGRGSRAVARAYAYVHVDGSGAAVAFSVRVWPPEGSSVAEGHRAELWCLVSGLPAFRSVPGPGADPESNSAVAVRWFHAPAGVPATEKGSVLLSRTTSGDVWAHERHKSRFTSGAVCMEAACLASAFRLELNDFSGSDGGRYSCEVLDRSGDETAVASAETLLDHGRGGAATTPTPPPLGWRHEEEFSADGEEGGEGAEIPAGLLVTTTPPGALFPAEHAFTEEVDFGPLSARVTPRPLVQARQGYPLSLVCEAAGSAATPGSLPPERSSQIFALWTHAPLGHAGPPRALLAEWLGGGGGGGGAPALRKVLAETLSARLCPGAQDDEEEEEDGGLPTPRRRWGASREGGGCAWGAGRASVLALRSATLQDAGSFACVLLALARGHRVVARAADVVRVEVRAAPTPAPSRAPITARISPASPLFVPPGGDATLWCSVDSSSSLSEVSVSWSVAAAAASSSWTPLLGLRSDGEPWVHERARRRHALGRLCPDAAPCGPGGRLHRLVLRAFGAGDQGRYACEAARRGARDAGGRRLVARDEVLVLLLLLDGESLPRTAGRPARGWCGGLLVASGEPLEYQRQRPGYRFAPRVAMSGKGVCTFLMRVNELRGDLCRRAVCTISQTNQYVCS